MITLVVIVSNAESVHLEDGTIIKGEVKEMNSQHIVIVTGMGEFTIMRDKIVKIVQGKSLIELLDGSTYIGKILDENTTSIKISTSFGEIDISKDQVKDIIDITDVEQPDVAMTNTSQNTELHPELGLDSADVMLYRERKKSVGTALALQTVGAGLIYAENYALGIPMVIIENGLLIAAPFVSGGGMVPMLIAGSVIKVIDTIITINSVQKYNNTLLDSIKNNSISKTPEKKDIIGGSFDLMVGYQNLVINDISNDNDGSNITFQAIGLLMGLMFPVNELSAMGMHFSAYLPDVVEKDVNYTGGFPAFGGFGFRFSFGKKVNGFAVFSDFGAYFEEENVGLNIRGGIYFRNFMASASLPVISFTGDEHIVSSIKIAAGYSFAFK